MITATILASLFALPTLSAPTSTPQSNSQERVPLDITFWTNSDCTVNPGPAAGSNNGFSTVQMTYGVAIPVPIRSYNLSRSLYSNEQLDFSTSGPNQGASLQMSMKDNPASCDMYNYSAYGSGRTMGCYTIESPFIYEMCAELIINAQPVGVDSGMLAGVQDGDASTPEEAAGTTSEPSSEPNNGFLPGQAQNGMLQPGQIHG